MAKSLSIILILLFIALSTCGCGKKMAPIPPDSLVPGEVRNLTVRQDGQALSLAWLIPKVNIDNQPLTDIQGFWVWRNHDNLGATASCPPELYPLAKIDLMYPTVGEVQGEAVRYRDDNLEPGKRYFYQVVGFDRSDHPGQTSATISHVWDILPQAPEKLTAQAGDQQVALSWPPVSRLANGQPLPEPVTYNLYREGPGSGLARVNTAPVTKAAFQDITVANEVTYRYLVRTVRQVGSGSLESLDSPVQTAKPEDLTPPAPVLNLFAVSTDQGVELRWDAGREPDLAGYRVFRRSLAEPQFQLLTPQPVAKPYFVDQTATRGVTYSYYVVAVDASRRGNQSLPSEAVSMTR